jgi:gliding motility-associated-like protein
MRLVLLIPVLFTGCFCFAQSQPSNDGCSGAAALCAGISQPGTTQGATVNVCSGCEDGSAASGNFCFPLNNSVWYSFTTNASGGAANVEFSGISCAAGTGNGIQAVVIEASTPCNETSYIQIGSCNSGQSGSFSLPLAGLNANTTYYIQVDGEEGASAPGACSFNIGISGVAVDAEITASVQSSNCTVADGEIDITQVSGGNAPYTYAVDNGSFQPSGTFASLAPGSHIVSVQDGAGCIFQQQIEVPQDNPPAAGIPVTVSQTCNASDGQIDIVGSTGGTPPYSYSLNGGALQAGSAFAGVTAGNHIVVVQDAAGCTDTVLVAVGNSSGVSDAAVNVSSSSCGGNDGSVTITPVGGAGPYSYSINGGASQPSATFSTLQPGTYSVLITDAAGCTFLQSGIQVGQTAADELLTIGITVLPQPACDGDNLTATTTITGNFTSATITFLYNGSVVQSGALFSYSTTSAVSADQIQVLVNATGSCLGQTMYTSSITTVEVLPVEDAVVTMSSDLSAACAGEPVVFTASQTGCTNPHYTWYVNGLAQTIASSDVFSTSFTSQVSVYVEVVCQGACSSPAQSNTVDIDIVEVMADAGPNQVMLLGASVTIEGVATGSGISWEPSESLSDPSIAQPVAAPEETTTYIMTVTNGSCSATDTMIVYVTPPIIPTNVITPNSDGKNDTWYIQFIEDYPGCKVEIFDRWGQKVYNSIGYTNQNAWDGKNRGLRLPASVYYYVIELNTNASDEYDTFTGYITLLY